MSIQNAIKELNKKIGTEVHVGPWLLITQAMVDQFAQLAGDTAWIHTDPERAAKESPYGRTVAHGFLTLSLITLLTGRVDVEHDIVPGVTLALNYGVNKVRFPGAVLVGKHIRSRTTLLKYEEAKGGLMIYENVLVEVEGQEKPGCAAETLTLLFFD